MLDVKAIFGNAVTMQKACNCRLEPMAKVTNIKHEQNSFDENNSNGSDKNSTEIGIKENILKNLE